MSGALLCRAGCGACCIAPSISSPVPGMQGGKPAGVRCLHLTDKYLCAIYGRPDRPAACASFRASELCGCCREEAIANLTELERLTGTIRETEKAGRSGT